MDVALRARKADKVINQSEASVSRASPSNQAVFLQKVRESNEAVNNGDFRRAVQLYSEAIELDPSNHILFTNRSAAYLKLGQCEKSVDDARRAKELNPKWVKAYLREGVALKHLGQHGDALGAFASGLAQDPNNAPLLSGLVDAALCSPLKEKLQATFIQLERLRLNRSPFVIISVIGQELLGAGHFSASVLMLESALKIGTCSLKLRGSVFSALSSAYWGLGNIDKAIHHMQQDMTVAKSLGDQDGECRAYGNLGSAYFSKGHYKEALTYNRYQLILSMKAKDRETAASALSSLGHVYTAIGDYPNALNSHKQCVLLRKQSGDKLAEAREIGNVGAVYLAMGNFDNAVECHQEHLKNAKKANNPVEEARAYSNLGSAYHYKRDYDRAMTFHKQVLKIAEHKNDKTLEARAYAGLGHASRCAGDTANAQKFHEKQLDNALQTKDRVAEARACANLGIIYHQLGEYDAALKLHKTNLRIATFLGDKASQGRAYGNIGNAHSSLGQHEDAVKYHNKELTIASEVNDHHSKGSTHGNVAVAYQALGMYEHALQHYLAHLNIARELKDTASEARALCNLGNFHCARREYSSAISFYEQNLILCQELHDVDGESKACFNLGYVHYSVENFAEAVRYYEQDLALARERKDRLSLARAYCNLGLAHKSLKNFSDSLECQKKCLGLMDALKNTPGKFRALGNIGDIMLKTGTPEEAISIYQQQLQLAKQCKNQDLIATAYGALGTGHRVIEQYDKALGYHTQELNIRQEMNDLKGECRAHGNIGNVHMSLANYMNAYKCYEEQLERSRELHDSGLEAQACGNLGITKMNMGQHEEAIGLFEQQLAMLEQLYGSATMKDKGKAFGNLGDCYEALGDYEEAVKCHEQFLALAQQSGSLSEQDRAYRGLGNAHRAIGNLQQALVCFEKRLVVAHELNSSAAKASAYGELGCLHSLLGNFEQAISCLEHQLSIAQEMEDEQCEGDAACGLGGVYQQMGEYEMALKYHQMDLHIAEATESTACQCRAYGNLGLSHESLGNYEDAVKYQEQHLSIAAQMNDRVAKTLAYSSLGRVHHALGHHTQAVQYLQQGLQIAEQLGRREDEAKIRHRLGLSLWGAGNLSDCQHQLYKAADLFEMIRRETQCSNDYKLSLFDLQTACYQALQRVLVALNQHDEALVVAERACTRAFIDLLLERQAGSAGLFNGTTMDLSPITMEQITNTVSQRNAFVLSFSIAAGFLYSWLLTPQDGIVKFHATSLSELESDHEHSDTVSMLSFSNTSILDHCIGQVRETIGVESHMTGNSSSSNRSHQRARLSGNLSESDGESDDVFQLQLEEVGDRLNAENDRTGFLRMVNRGHAFNSSTYSLNSLFSLGGSFSATGRKGSVRGGSSSGKSPLAVLYQYLIGPMEETLCSMTDNQENVDSPGPVDLVLVLQGDLFLIPFLMLKEKQDQEYLFERFNLIIVPSINAIQNSQKMDKHGRPVIGSSGALVVGNPKLTPSICQHWHLCDISGAEFEAGIVGEILSCRPLIGSEATKGAVLHQIEQVEVIHFAAHISWKLSSIVLSPSESVTSSGHFSTIDSDDAASDISSFDGPALSEYLLTAADILNLKLHAKLVVLNSAYTDDRAGRVNTDGVIGLTRSLLSAGAQCVLFSLWPVPDQATKMLMRTMYLSLEEGQRVTQALSKAIKTVQCTHQFSHPSNWGGWVLVGSDIKLSSKLAQMGHAICEILQSPTQCREAMRVLLHLIEKSLQRIHQGTKNSMYTTYQSIENKVGGVSGWKDLLQAVGFRFEPSANGLPPAVFFPMTDPADRLTQASNSLQALLGLPPISVTALSKFVTNFDVGEALIVVMRVILSKLSAKETGIDVLVNVQLWRAPGCHEFLASLGLDLVDVGQDNVTLRLSKQAIRRHLQFALQALAAVFDAMDAPRSHSLNTSSSMESLSSSSQSSSMSTSTFSSPPPQSPRGKKSLFNPAEMEKMKHSRTHLMNKSGLVGRKSHISSSSRSQQLDPSLQLSLQSAIRNMYPPNGEPRLFQFDSLNTTDDTSDAPSSSPCFTDTPDTPSPVSHNRLGTGLFRNEMENRYRNGSAISPRPCISSSRAEIETSERKGYDQTVNPGTRQQVDQTRLDNISDKTNGQTNLPNDSENVEGSLSNPSVTESLENQNGETIMSVSKTSEIRKQFENMSRFSAPYVAVKKSVPAREDSKRHSVGSRVSSNGEQNKCQITFNKSQNPTEDRKLSDQEAVINGPQETNWNPSGGSKFSNQSDHEATINGPQQTMHSDGLGHPMLNPEELAKKVMADVPNVREVIEKMQHMSFVQSQQNSMQIRQAAVQQPASQQEILKRCASNSEVSLPNTLYNSRNQLITASSPAHTSSSSPSHGESSHMDYGSSGQVHRKVNPPSRSSSLSYGEASHMDYGSSGQARRNVTPPSRNSSVSHSEISNMDYCSSGQMIRKITPPSRSGSASHNEISSMDYSSSGPPHRKMMPPSNSSVSHSEISHFDHSSSGEARRKVTPPSKKQFSNQGPGKNDMIVNSVTRSPIQGPNKGDLVHNTNSNGQSCENSISSDNSEGADSNLQSSVSSGYHSERNLGSDLVTNTPKADRDMYTQDFVNRTPANAYSTSAVPFSSFRPYQPASPMVKTNALSRPDSTTSTSSQYSTSSSSRSVIYRPIPEEPGSSVSTNHIPSWTMKPLPQNHGIESNRLKHSKHVPLKKTKKKVSFSDSEAGDSSNTSFDESGREQSPQNFNFESAINSVPSNESLLEYHSLGRSYDQKHSQFQQSQLTQQLEKNSHSNTSAKQKSETLTGLFHRGDNSKDSAAGVTSFSMKPFIFDKEKKNAAKSHVLQSSKC